MRSFQEALGGWEQAPCLWMVASLLRLRSGSVRREFTVEGQEKKKWSHAQLWAKVLSEEELTHSQGFLRDLEEQSHCGIMGPLHRSLKGLSDCG